MGRSRIGQYLERIREELLSAFREAHTPREIALSFAVGTFITMLPTLGTGFLLFFVILYLYDRVSPIALFASVLVFNPIVKWGVYAASIALGFLLLGPVEGLSGSRVSFNAAPELVVRLLVGNLILAVIATVVGYVVVLNLAVRYANTDVVQTIDEAVTEVAEVVLEP